MAPIVHECQRRAGEVDAIVCLTGQHREMLTQVTEFFGIHADDDLDVMLPDQTLAGLTAKCVQGIAEVLDHRRPHCVVAQGDTTTVLAASLAAFYAKLPFVHVEAGLRTGNLSAPWPEELNRRVADLVSTLYCAPTERAAEALLAEGVPSARIRVTGNTVVDALLATVGRHRKNGAHLQEKYAFLGEHPTILITGHRRENFGQGVQNVCRAIAVLANRFPQCRFVYPVHLNPNVRQPVTRLLGNRANVHLIAPVAYPEFVWLMERSHLILTDSGGVQEEAPTLRKPVLVMRDTTERPEAVEAGAARLVGTSPEAIVAAATSLLTDDRQYAACQIDHNPYGDGRAAARIVEWMLEQDWASS